MTAFWRQPASSWLPTAAWLCVAGLVSACVLDRTGYQAIPGPVDAGVELADMNGGRPGVDLGEAVTPDETGPRPRDSGPAPADDLGPMRDARPMDPPDLGPPGLPDAGPMTPDLGPPAPPDLGPLDPPDLGPTAPTPEERCRARYGGVEEFILCFATDSVCGFNARTLPDCDVTCLSGGGACVRAHNNPNDPGQECEVGFEEPCGTDRTTEICVCTSF